MNQTPEGGDSDKSNEQEDVRERPSQIVWKHGAMIKMASEKSGIVVVANPKDTGYDKSGTG